MRLGSPVSMLISNPRTHFGKASSRTETWEQEQIRLAKERVAERAQLVAAIEQARSQSQKSELSRLQDLLHTHDTIYSRDGYPRTGRPAWAGPLSRDDRPFRY